MMRVRLALSLIFVTLIVGCVYSSDSLVEHWSYKLNKDEYTEINNTRIISGEKNVIGWKISWNLTTYDYAQIGPYRITYDWSAITSFSPIVIWSATGSPKQSNGAKNQTVDPCRRHVPNANLTSLFAMWANGTDGIVHLTEYRDVLTVLDESATEAIVSLECPIECKKFVLINATEATDFVLTLTSGINSYFNYSYALDQCLTSDNALNSYVNGNGIETVVHAYNTTQIWFMFHGYQLSNSSDNNKVTIKWRVNSGFTKPSTETLLWVLTSAVVLVLIVVVVVVIVIRKKRANYAQIQ